MGVVDTVLRFFIGTRNERLVRSYQPLVDEILELFPETNALSDEQLRAKTEEFRNRLREGETLDDLLVEAFACVREASWRMLGGKRWVKDTNSGEEIPYKAHFPVQLLGGIVLHKGTIAEMVTGEGKTFVATLAAYLNALEARGVHVVTVNDYLARRDAEEQGRVLGMLGMTCGYIQSDMDNEERRAMYGCDVTYGTNNEFGFDYLRDNMKVNPRQQCQRDLHYAIIDEVDSILIDEARTPLIISGSPEGTADKYAQADKIAKTLKGVDAQELKEKLEDKHGKAALLQDRKLYQDALNDYDFEKKEKEQQCLLTETGVKKVEKALGIKNLYDGAHMEWPHLLEQALRANNIYLLDKDYVIYDGESGPEIVIVDEFTGRMQHGRRWSDGLHQAVEAKHDLVPKAESYTLATITLQNYFKLYNKLAGMTGTAMTEANEFAKIYKLDVVAIPTNRRLVRQDNEDLIYGTANEKWEAIAAEIEKMHKEGRPILVGTTSVEKSEHLSRLLKTRGLEHNTLNAKYHEREADIVAQAGRKGNITVATNMAGRGTDILLGGNPKYMATQELKKEGISVDSLLPDEFKQAPSWTVPREVRLRAEVQYDELLSERAKKYQPECDAEHDVIVKLGGLCVIGTERHESRRIDNQLRGRCGRQGDPGSSQFFLSLEDDLMRLFAGQRIKGVMQTLGLKDGQPIQSKMVSGSVERAQKKVEQRNFDIRKNLIEYDDVNNGQRKAVYRMRQVFLGGLSRGDYFALEGEVRKHVRAEIKRIDNVDKVTDKTRFSAKVAKELSQWADRKHEAEIHEDALRDIPCEEAVFRIAHTIRGRIHGEKLREAVTDRIDNVIQATIERNVAKNIDRPELWDLGAVAADYQKAFDDSVNPDDMPKGEGGIEHVKTLKEYLLDRAMKLYEERETKVCSGQDGKLLKTPAGRPDHGRMRQLERYLLLQSIDEHWKQHLKNLEVLKGSIHWESYAQKDPKDAYKKKGHEIFEVMLDNVDMEVISTLFRIEVQFEDAPRPASAPTGIAIQPAAPGLTTTSGMPQPTEAQQQTRRQMEQAANPNATANTGYRAREKHKLPGPNDPCHCGSGKKYKKCHMAEDQAGAAR
ncbi:MAG: preprotein translocase subunit SecA [Planctomycetes bacterium]|nr:preprotein translocase subunit SecA [Planctomycetota bacterium]MCW8135423.1 preprotein translocase subunit SecA [Planctomycetota bacterium]